jgi:signal transduction histidine kinase
VGGALACAALFVRRRWPVWLAVALLVGGRFSHFVTGPTIVALFTVAAHRRPRTTAWVAALALVPLPFFLAQRPDPDDPRTGSALTALALLAAAIGWGMYVRARRQFVASLRERAGRVDGEETEAEAARRAREELAGEMDDVLAHRLSLLRVQAGELERSAGASAAEVGRAAGAIRESAHRALEDLREVIGVLRATTSAGPEPEPGGPEPGEDGVPRGGETA